MFLTSVDAFSNNLKRRNYFIAFLAGAITAIAWWIIIDILARSTEHLFPRVYIVPGSAITFMLIILHCIPDSAIQDENTDIHIFDGGGSSLCNSTKCRRLSLFLVFLIIFSAVVASIWLFIVNYVSTDVIEKQSRRVQWFGVGNIVFTVLLAIAALLSRFGRKETDSLII